MRFRNLRGFLACSAAAASIALAAPAPAATYAGLWHMDESSGTTAVDASGNGNDGTLSNISFVAPGFDGTGGAYSFNGTNSRVIVPDAPSLNPLAQNVTIVAHVNFTVAPPISVGDYDLIRKKGGNGGQQYKMEILGSGKAHCVFKGSVAVAGLTVGPNLADGAWHTITCTKTSASITLDVDGNSHLTKNVTIGSISNPTALILGGKADASGDWYHGTMDETSVGTG